MRKSKLPAIFIAGILLSTIPVLFRKPAATIIRLDEIAILAAEVSVRDAFWMGDNTFFNSHLPEPGTVAFGSHEYYPYHLTTVRDSASGAVMVMITSRLSIPSVIPQNTSTHSFKAAVDDGKVYVLIHDGSDGSWPARLFSVISND
ncbi:MAG: hypothetical protein K8R76_04430 [Candidatus Aegiribacteria sp.]|nr:hypothetical protein [Candidatus Aegiribacteria sp.]